MRVFEHFEAFPTPCDGGTVTRSMRRVAHPTLYRFSAGGRVRERASERATLSTIQHLFHMFIVNISHGSGTRNIRRMCGEKCAPQSGLGFVVSCIFIAFQ
jgi:hypothetical protein